MSILIGDKQTFAVECGEFMSENRSLRRVDMWAADRWWTCDDNCAYVPQFLVSVARTLEQLRSGRDYSLPLPGLTVVETYRRLLAADDGSHQRFWFANWGPTTDNVSSLMFRDGQNISIPFEFWRDEHHKPEELGVVFVAELAEEVLVRILEETIARLQSASA